MTVFNHWQVLKRQLKELEKELGLFFGRMPPPPQPQHLQPLEGAHDVGRNTVRQIRGSKRSRALWDPVLRPSATASRLLWLRDIMLATLYEVQPVRYSEGLALSRSVIIAACATIQLLFSQMHSLPRRSVALWWFFRQHSTFFHLEVLLGCIVYYWIVRYLHE